MGEMVSVFLYLLYFPSYDVINHVIMSDADCTLGREPRSVAARFLNRLLIYIDFQCVYRNFSSQLTSL